MKKLTRGGRKVNAEVLGLDVHQRVIAYSLLDRRGDEVQAGVVDSRAEALRALLDRAVGRKRTHVTLEACGGMLWVYDLLVERYGRERVHVAQPKRIRAIANSTEKNDANDAWWLAYLTLEGRLPEAYIPEGAYRELRVATRERERAVRARSEEQVRLKSHLRQMGKRLPTRRVDGEASWKALQELAAATEGSLGMALGLALGRIEALEREVAVWDERIGDLAKDLPEVEAVAREMPGMGRVLAATVVAEAGPMGRFPTAKAFARYTGLTPSDRSTGGRTIHGGITREGSPHLRWALTQAVMVCCRMRRGAGLAVGEWVRARQRRMGSKAKARVAAARKLAECLWRLFHWGECFDAARAFGGVPRKAAA